MSGGTRGTLPTYEVAIAVLKGEVVVAEFPFEGGAFLLPLGRAHLLDVKRAAGRGVSALQLTQGIGKRVLQIKLGAKRSGDGVFSIQGCQAFIHKHRIRGQVPRGFRGLMYYLTAILGHRSRSLLVVSPKHTDLEKEVSPVRGSRSALRWRR